MTGVSPGASLAQDRGRLEARIEVLTSELETQRKRADGDLDALKIKTKILDDQTETIRKLKEVMAAPLLNGIRGLNLRPSMNV